MSSAATKQDWQKDKEGVDERELRRYAAMVIIIVSLAFVGAHSCDLNSRAPLPTNASQYAINGACKHQALLTVAQ